MHFKSAFCIEYNVLVFYMSIVIEIEEKIGYWLITIERTPCFISSIYSLISFLLAPVLTLMHTNRFFLQIIKKNTPEKRGLNK